MIVERPGQPDDPSRWMPENTIPVWTRSAPELPPANAATHCKLETIVSASLSNAPRAEDHDAARQRMPMRPPHLVTMPAKEPSAADIALAALSAWRQIDSELSPIIGQHAVATLYKRSLFLARAEHPCLATAYDAATRHGEFAPLQAALSQQPEATAAAASGAILRTFSELLTSLVGQSLSEQLLRSISKQSSGGKAVQEPQT